MATKKVAVAKKEEAKKAVPEKKSEKKAMTAEEKAARKAKRAEALKNRPAGQRPNSKQIDIIEFEGGKVMAFGYAIRKKGTLVTSVLFDANGVPVGVATELVEGTKVKSKKGHGTLNPGVAGEGKRGRGAAAEDEADEDEDDDEEEDED